MRTSRIKVSDLLCFVMIECRGYISDSADDREQSQSKNKSEGLHYIGIEIRRGPRDNDSRR